MKNTKKPKVSVLIGIVILVTIFTMSSCGWPGWPLYNAKGSHPGADPTDPDNDLCKDGHDFVYKSSVDPTCTESGYDIYECSRTSGVTEQRTTGVALGHQAPDGWDATCTVDGNTGTGDCTRCGEDVKGETIDKFGHSDKTIPNSQARDTGLCQNNKLDGSKCNHLLYAINDIGPGNGRIFYVADGLSDRLSVITVQGHDGSFSAYTAYYLEAAPANVANSLWGNSNVSTITSFTDNTDTRASDIGNGRRNTQLIITHMDTQNISNTAAHRAAAEDSGGKHDWFLPSLGELRLYYQSSVSDKPTGRYWWSSSQYNNDSAWVLDLTENPNGRGVGKTNSQNTRAIRAF